MEKRLKNILDEKKNKFSDWSQTFDKYISSYSLETNLNKKEHKKITLNFISVLKEILQSFKEYSNVRDSWGEIGFRLFPLGDQVEIKAKKIKTNFYFGYDMNGFYLNTLLSPSYNIKNMPDSFWVKFLKLKDLGNMKFTESTGISSTEGKEIEKKFNTRKSQLFNLLKNYFLSVIFENQSNELGEIKLHWSKKIEWNDLIKKGCKSFKILYKLNYSLWKISDLRKKRK